ncbi:hypothetical protein K2173_017434 [Erythroxylum novogranatense]|uniref:Uncharacterized protein n=1 Tax=Erythroxylum novogranatense TaxID=1862640 RepID=A0AAV8TMC8_9ROSI|nr:hypothetical protein K2173_017434 [Erythroxylum novogranatense]
MAAREPFNATANIPTPVLGQHSPWHSPVPYLFGGFAAMLGLIAFALLILACSYWKLSGFLDNSNDGERDLEAGGGQNKSGDSEKQGVSSFAEKILVIMAGENRPTFLATPMSSRSTSFGNSSGIEKRCSCSGKSEKLKNIDGDIMMKQVCGDNHRQVGGESQMETPESSDQTQ